MGYTWGVPLFLDALSFDCPENVCDNCSSIINILSLFGIVTRFHNAFLTLVEWETKRKEKRDARDDLRYNVR